MGNASDGRFFDFYMTLSVPNESVGTKTKNIFKVICAWCYHAEEWMIDGVDDVTLHFTD